MLSTRMKMGLIFENKVAADHVTESKNMPDEYKKLESWDETDRSINQMGYFGWRPRFLEVFNTPSLFTTIFSLSNLFMVMSYSVFAIIIPTLESVFNLSSTQTGFILMANDISGMVAALIMAHYCSARKIRWISIGMLIVVISAVLPASSTFFIEYPQPNHGLVEDHLPSGRSHGSLSLAGNRSLQSMTAGTCNDTRTTATMESEGAYAENNHKYYSLFVLGSMLQGIGGTPPGIAGSTYMDEIFTQKQFGIAISILYIVSFVGYPFAMLLGAKFLTFYVTLGPPPEGVTMKSKEWVGAWWVGMVIPSAIVFLLSFITALYPRQMPAARKVLEDKVKRGFTTVREKTKELNRSLKEITKDMIPSYKRILKKKAVVCLIVSDIFLFLHYGAYTYYPKIFSLLFRLDAKEMGTILGYCNIIGFSIGLILGGVLTRWKNWSAKTLQMIYSIVSLVGIPFSFAILLYCPVDTFAGVDVQYFPDTSSQFSPLNMTATCNSNCSCTTAFYQPVCDQGITYFSPCHAGCMTAGTQQIDDEMVPQEYHDCACTETGTARYGPCGTACSKRLWIAMTIYVIGTAVGFLGFAAHAIVYQRIVAEVDRTAAQGLRQSITRIFGTLPSPLIFGYLLDSTCLVWRRSSSGEQGNCWIYDIDTLIIWLLCLQLIFKVLTCIFCWLCWWLFPEIVNENLENENHIGDHKLEKISNENGNVNAGHDDDCEHISYNSGSLLDSRELIS